MFDKAFDLFDNFEAILEDDSNAVEEALFDDNVPDSVIDSKNQATFDEFFRPEGSDPASDVKITLP